MRIATSYSASRALEGIQERQFEQGKLQDQIATGLRIRTPGDDPLAAAQAEMARSRLSHNAQEKRAIQLGNALLSSADAAFADGIDELQVARDTLVAAANGSYGPSERKILAERLRGVRISLLEVANSRDSAGGYVFSAQGSAGKPFPDGIVPVLEAIPGEQRIGGPGGYMASLDGQAWFLEIPQGNGVFVTSAATTNTGTAVIDAGQIGDASQLTGHEYRISFAGAGTGMQYAVEDVTAGITLLSGVPYQPGASITMSGERVVLTGTPEAGDTFAVKPAARQSIFETLDDAIALLERSDLTAPAYANRLTAIQANLDGALDRMILGRTRVGEEMRMLEQDGFTNEDRNLQLKAVRSGLEDADPARVLSELQTNQIGLQAALQAYAKFSRMSLFDAMG